MLLAVNITSSRFALLGDSTARCSLLHPDGGAAESRLLAILVVLFKSPTINVENSTR